MTKTSRQPSRVYSNTLPQQKDGDSAFTGEGAGLTAANVTIRIRTTSGAPFGACTGCELRRIGIHIRPPEIAGEMKARFAPLLASAVATSLLKSAAATNGATHSCTRRRNSLNRITATSAQLNR